MSLKSFFNNCALIGGYYFDPKSQKDLTDWRPDFREKWDEVSIDAYKIIDENAKARHEEMLSDSESITNKTLIVLGALAGFYSFILPFKYETAHLPFNQVAKLLAIFAVCLIFILSILVVIRCFELLFPKDIKARGEIPSEFIPNDLLDFKSIQEKMLYYCSIVKLQSKIEFVLSINEKRAKKYRWILIASLVSILLTIAVLFTPLG